MLISNLIRTHSSILNKLSIPDITEPLPIRVFWFRADVLDEKDFSNRRKMHLHTFFEVHMVVNGSVQYSTTDGQHHKLEEGQGIIISPRTVHVLDGYNNFIKVSLAFSPDEKSDFYKQQAEKPLYIFDITPEIIHSINSVLKETTLRTFFSLTLIKNHILDIICSISSELEIYEYHAPQNISVEDKRVTEAKLYIQDNKNKWITSDEVANHCSLSVKQLNRLFYASTGKNLHEYIKMVKVKEAEFLLSSTTLTIKEISKQLDFSSVQYFNRFFSKNAGLTPAHFRQLSEK